ncbi:thioesterase II family protein [Dyella humi]|uniref:Thioesterase n=1 Tax=Dyella humi TaxID=1770547 RepID=A0ABW8IE77_9GAMM
MNDRRHTARWLVRQASEIPARARLICLPYACGTARVFHGWTKSLRGIEVVAVEAPGKGARVLEPPCTNLDDICQALLTEMTPLLEQPLPYSFFGHSYGGLLAYELCSRLQAAGAVMPQRLLLSACGAPWARAPRSYSTLDDAAFKDLLREYNATPPEILANDAMLDLLLPGLRADFVMVENYKSNWPPLHGVVTHVFYGAEDDIAEEELSAWQQGIDLLISLECLPGDHFFIHDERDALLKAIAHQLYAIPGRTHSLTEIA